MGNQQSGKQQTALANSVLAYAEHIADPSVLMPAIRAIAQKHTSVNIRPEQYLIVGEHLIASIGEVLGDAATPAILEAWTIAYDQLAGILSGHEAELYREHTLKPGGWAGWRLFKVMRKETESAEICSFYLSPADGGKVALHQPGQYISVKLLLPALKMNQIRQYSISSAPSEDYYRISVKRETNPESGLNGMISHQLHDAVETGSIVEVSAPSGNFMLPEMINTPLVFISGGVGVTPFMSMIEHLVNQQKPLPITWIHGCRNESVHAFKGRMKELSKKYSSLKTYIFYDQCSENNRCEQVYEGHPDIDKIGDLATDPGTTFFICGPGPFIQKQFKDLRDKGVDIKNIFFEEFGPQLLHLN